MKADLHRLSTAVGISGYSERCGTLWQLKLEFTMNGVACRLLQCDVPYIQSP